MCNGRIWISGAWGAILVAAASIAVTADAKTLQSEPATGSLKIGQVVLVNDGSCGNGKIKKVTRRKRGIKKVCVSQRRKRRPAVRRRSKSIDGSDPAGSGGM